MSEQRIAEIHQRRILATLDARAATIARLREALKEQRRQMGASWLAPAFSATMIRLIDRRAGLT